MTLSRPWDRRLTGGSTSSAGYRGDYCGRKWRDNELRSRMITARGLSKRYGGKTAVDDLSFQVRPGVVTGFLGPNGAGKSTTMRLMLDLDYGGGETRFDGRRFARSGTRCVKSVRCW